MSQTLCAIPWNHVAVQQNGDLRACCQCISPPFGKLTKDDGTEYNVVRDSLDEARNSSVLKDMRASMMRGEKPEACNLCWKDESQGFDSRRFHVNKMYGQPDITTTKEDGTIDVVASPLRYMDIRFGNLCNQACRSCGPTDSSLWYEESAELSPGFKYYGEKFYPFKKKGTTWIVDSEDFFWYDKPNFAEEFKKHIHQIDRIYFTGGEPTVNKAHFKTLDTMIEEGVAGKVCLEYNSNMMAIPEHLIEKWRHFGRITIGASLDAYGSLANYVRYPSEWSVVEKNFLRLDSEEKAEIQLGISSTISILNVLNFLDLVRWSLKQPYKRARGMPSYHMLHGPNNLNVQILPPDLKAMIKEEYEKFFAEINDPRITHYMRPIISFMEEGRFDAAEMRVFFHRMKLMDASRGQDLVTALPWLAKWKVALG